MSNPCVDHTKDERVNSRLVLEHSTAPPLSAPSAIPLAVRRVLIWITPNMNVNISECIYITPMIPYRI